MAQTGIPPRACAANSDTEFGLVAAALDQAEATAGNRPGGPTAADVSAARLIEARLRRLRPHSADDWRWVAERLARAMVNGWSEAATAPLLRLAL